MFKTKYIVNIGDRFGRLVVVKSLGGKHQHFICECNCGQTKRVSKHKLVTEGTTSCRCYANELTTIRNIIHGKTGTRTHNAWMAMIKRCRDPNNKNWNLYGGRGITVCKQWQSSFKLFLADMGECPPGMTIERNNGNGNYEPDNCRWATQAEQARNTSRSYKITFHGVTKCLAEWARELDMTHDALAYRIANWGVKLALTTPKSSRYTRDTKEIL